jgi:hypothetical protein
VGKDEQDDLGLVEGVDDGGGVFVASEDVAGSDPARYTVRFERGARSVSYKLILAGVADEDLVRHRVVKNYVKTIF